MRLNCIPLFFLLLSLIYSNDASATVFNAIANGDWDEVTTWNQGSVPGSLDTVSINGYTVTVDINTGNVTIKNIILTNSSNIGVSKLLINGLVTVTVTDDLSATSLNVDKGVEVQLLNGAIMNVEGNVDFTRSATNNVIRRLVIKIEDASQMVVSGNFTFDYKNANGFEVTDEIFLDDTAILDVTGTTTLYIRDGEDFDFRLQGASQAILRGNLDVQMPGGDKMNITSGGTSHFQVMGNVTVNNSGSDHFARLHADGTAGKFTIEGNLTLNSTVADKITYLEATNSDCVIDVRGNISMSALSEGDVYIDLKESSNLYIGEEFLRPANYGALLMGESATLTYNGTQSQLLAAEDLEDNGTDAFHLTNVVLNNSFGFTLEDTLYVENNLELTSGKITTTSTEILIIGDQATITGGSETAYINGPMIKQGSSNDDPFIFPIGDETNYAPIEISSISTPASEYIVEYFGDPPPFGNAFAAEVRDISENQYWTVTKTAGSDDVDIILHWTDADASGIDDLDSLLVVGLNASNIWESFGNGGTTGGTGIGVPGSISSLMGDPPPFGITRFTFGLLAPDEVLPVELTYFDAIQHGETVNLKWQTAAEFNTSHFVVERSNDGYRFTEIGTILSKGESNFMQNYSTTDASPFSSINYYRLKIVDFDGLEEYSPVEVVNFQRTEGLSVYPNPVDKILSLNEVNALTDEGVLEVFGINGQRIYVGNCSLEKGKFQITTDEINVHLPGVYLLRFTCTSGSQILRFNKL